MARVVTIDRIYRKWDQQMFLPSNVDRGKRIASADFDADLPGQELAACDLTGLRFKKNEMLADLNQDFDATFSPSTVRLPSRSSGTSSSSSDTVTSQSGCTE